MYDKNNIIEYLNISYLENKILSLKKILHEAPIDILCIDKTKFDKTFLDAQFMIFQRVFVYIIVIIYSVFLPCHMHV